MNATTYKGHVIVKVRGGWDIERGGEWVAWTAGTLADAKNVVDELVTA